MGDTVDTRVVRMEFDNKQFEKNVKQTSQSLENLKQNLDFEDTGKSIDKVSLKLSALQITATTFIANIANRLSNLAINIVKSLSVDNITTGWSKFGEKTTSVATMLAQKIRIAGEEITDLAEKTEIVNEQLELLSWFSDETSYSFTDMSNNVGKFIAAGQDLDTSVKAMEGIATWAAKAGQNSSTASRAMYQLAQAMGKGKIQKIDWMSIQNANMDTEDFRETILATAVSLGELTKEGDEFVTKTNKKFKQSAFADYLSEGWFTSEVLVKGLEKYSAAVEQIYEIAQREGISASQVIEEYGDQLDEFGLSAFKAAQEARTLTDALNSVKDAVSSKWMTTFENIFGNESEAVKLWTDLANELYDVFAESGNFRNDILAIWKTFKGRDDLFAKDGPNQGAFWNLYDSIIAIKDAIKSAWDKIFPLSEMEDESSKAEEIARKLKDITQKIKEFTQTLLLSEETTERISKVFQVVFKALKLGLNIIKAIRFIIDPIIDLGKQLVGQVLDQVLYYLDKLYSVGNNFEKLVYSIRNALYSFLESLNLSSILSKIFAIVNNITSLLFKLTPILSKIFSIAIEIINIVVKASSKLLGIITKIIDDVLSFLAYGNVLEKIKKTLSDIPNILNKFSISINGDSIIKSLGETFNGILNTIKEFINSILDFSININSEFGKAIQSVFNGIISILKSIVPILQVILKVIGKLLEMIGTTLNKVANAFLNVMNGNTTDKFLRIIITLGIAALLFVTIYNILWLIKRTLAPILTLTDSIGDVCDSITKKLQVDTFNDLANIFLKFAIALSIIASINEADLFKSIAALLLLSGIFAILISVLTSIETSVKVIQRRSKTITKSIAGIFDQIRENIQASQKTDKLVTIVSVINKIVNMFIKIAIAMKLLGTIKIQEFYNGIKIIALLTLVLAAIALVFYGIGSIPKISEKIDPLIQEINKITKSLIIASLALALISKLNVREIAKASLIMAGVIAAITLIFGLLNRILPTKKIKNTKTKMNDLQNLFTGFNFLMIGASIIMFARAIIAISDAVAALSAIDPGRLWSSIGAISLLLVLLTTISVVMNKFSGGSVGEILSLGGGLAILSLSVIPLAIALMLLSSIDIKSLGKSLLILGGAFALIVAVAFALRKASASILSFGGAIALIGLGILLAGLGLSALATGFVAICSLISTHFEEIKTAMVGLADIIGTILWNAFLTFIQRMTMLIPYILSFVEEAIISILNTIMKFKTDILEVIIGLIDSLLSVLANHADSIFESVFSILVSLLTKLEEKIDPIVESLFVIFAKVLDKLIEYIPLIVEKLLTMLHEIAKTLFYNSKTIAGITGYLFGFIGLVLADLSIKLVSFIGLTSHMILIFIGQVIKTVIASLGTLASLFVILVGQIFLTLLSAYYGIRYVIRKIFVTIIEDIVNTIIDLVTFFAPALSIIGDIILQAILAGLLKTLTSSFKWLLDIIDFIFGTNLSKMLTSSIDSLVDSVAENGKKTIKGLSNKAMSLIDKSQENIKSGLSEIGDAINDASQTVVDTTQYTLSAAEKSLTKGINVITDTTEKSVESFTGIAKSFGNMAGENIIEGIVEGVKNNSDSAEQAGIETAKSYNEGFCEEEEINSPSKVFKKLGNYLMQGLSLGIEDSSDDVSNSMNSVMSKSISLANDIISDQNGNDITLTVGMDISNVEAQSSRIQDIMSSVNNPNITPAGINAGYSSSTINRNNGAKGSVNPSASTTNSTEVTYNNTFNIESSDPQQSAEEIDKILQQQALRKKLAHGS